MTKASVVRSLEIAGKVWQAMDDRNLGLIAAGVAFYSMLAVFPGMAATIAIWGFFADPNVMQGYLQLAREFMPAEAYAILEDQFSRLLAANVSTLGWTTAVSLAIGLYSAHSGVYALVTGLNAIHARAHREGIMRFVATVLLTLALIALILAALMTVVVVPTIVAFVPLGRMAGVIITLLPQAALFVVVLTVLGMFYRWAPNLPGERHGWFTPGAFVAASLWAITSIAFSLYLANFGTYNRIYGSIGAVIALLMWFYLSAYIVLFGGVLNAELARMRLARLNGQADSSG